MIKFLFCGWASFVAAAALPPLHPVVEVAENVYSHEPADNGAGPMWCSGSTSLVRLGDHLFASGLETLPDCPPLNNCRWLLFHRGTSGWRLAHADPSERTREPSPLAGWADGHLFLSANPTLRTNREPGGGPAQPRLLQFSAERWEEPGKTLLPVWQGNPRFTEHSYRSLASDRIHRELILFQNIDYTHAEWSFLDREGQWSAQGRLPWPWGADYAKPQPIRVCYPNVALHNRAVHFCGVSDIQEPNPEWRQFKRQLTGREWDYDFRRLFYTWSADIRTGKFEPWVEVASREKTAGWISPGDLWVAPDGAVHILWTERAIDTRLRDKFFPGAQQSHALNYAILREGKVLLRRTLVEAGESGVIPSAGRFQVTAAGRLVVFYYMQGRDASGGQVSENRVMEISEGNVVSASVRVPLEPPLTSVFTATVRAGSAPSDTLELFGLRAGASRTMAYARVRLFGK